MDNVLAARILMGASLGFHIIYATIGIGLPLMLMIAEGLSLRTGDEDYHRMARNWIRPAGVVFAIGAVSGTMLSFELGLLWPRFMAFSGAMIGLPFWMEGFAFFTEAIFLALYLYGEKRLSRPLLFFCTIPLTLAAAASAVFVIAANAWMNTPAGFSLMDGKAVNISPWQAMGSPAWFHEAVHGTLAAYVATGFVMAGIFVFKLKKSGGTAYYRKGLNIAMAVATFFLPFMLLSGDWAAGTLAKQQKAKLAAAEALFETQQGAPLIIGGWPDPSSGKVLFALEIPKLLSLLAHEDPNAVVVGLDAFPPGTAPDPRLVHPFFDLMVGSFFLMAAGALFFWWTRWRRKPIGNLTCRMLLVASPFGLIALESGWLVTEFGRQPWAAQGVMRVADAATPHQGISLVLLAFTLIYLALTVGMLKLLLGSRVAPKVEGAHDQP